MCGECPSKESHNGLCSACAASLRIEFEQYKQAMAAGVWVDHRRLTIIQAALEDYDTPQELPWGERAIATLLRGNYNPEAWK